MKRKKIITAVSTALLLTTSASAGVTQYATIPATPDEQAEFEHLEWVMHFRQTDSQLLMKQFLTDHPSSIYRDAVTMMLADSYFYDRQFSLAYQYYNQIRDDAFSGDVQQGFFYRKAFCLLKRGYYTEAAWYYRNLAGIEQYRNDADFYLAYIDYVNGEYDKAYNQFLKIKSSGHKISEVEYYINQIDYLHKEYAKVASTSESLLKGNIPVEMMGETMRVGGLSYFKLGDKARAKDLLNQYVDYAGDGAELTALYSLGTIYYDEGNYDKALKLFNDITKEEEQGPLVQSAWLYIGQIYVALDDPQAAVMAFDKAANQTWDYDVAEAASYNRAVTLASGNTIPFADTVETMESFITNYPHSPYISSLSKYLANAYYSRRDYDAALRQLDRISPQDASVKATRQKILYQKGVDDMQEGRITAAIQALTEASSASSPDKEVAAQAALWLGDAYFDQDKYAEAAKAYQNAIGLGKLGDNTGLAYYNLGYSYMKQDNYTQAENAFKKAYDSKTLTSQQAADARLRYADCLYYNRKYSDALSLFRTIKNEGGDKAYVSLREAEILGRQGKINEKITILESIVEQGAGTSVYSAALASLADAYSEKGDDRKAAQLYSRIIETGSVDDNSDAYYALATNAENLYNAGDLQGALESYRQLEKSGIPALYKTAILGIMRSSSSNAEILEYASKVESQSGISADIRTEAIFRGAKAGLALGGDNRAKALESLKELSESSDRYWAAQSAVMAGDELLKDNNIEEAEKILSGLIEKGTNDNYWLARGYIGLADVYKAKGDNHLAKLYLETLKSNYPGSEKDIKDMIDTRLKNLKQ